MSTQHVGMEAGASKLAVDADTVYFSGLRELTIWSERDRQLKQTGTVDLADHLMGGFRVLERISQIAREAVSSYDEAIARTQRATEVASPIARTQRATEVASLIAKRARYTGTAQHLGMMFEQLGQRMSHFGSAAVAGRC